MVDDSVVARLNPVDIAACRALLRTNSTTFYISSMLLPKSVRDPASALYAFCRVADDAVDLQLHPSQQNKLAAVDVLRERLERVFAGRPMDAPPDRAFADVVAAFNIPKALPDALLEGFLWDAEERRYANLSELYDYAARVAGSVGAMMSLLMRTRDAGALARACDLGVAMQLSNIARDIGEDARAGRVYLPLEWLSEASVDVPQWLAVPVFTPALGGVVERLLAEADALYSRAETGVTALPKNCQPGINAARFLYAEIGREVERAGMDSVSRRAVVPIIGKLKLLAKVIVAGSANKETPTATAQNAALANPPIVNECRFLIDACLGAGEAQKTLRKL